MSVGVIGECGPGVYHPHLTTCNFGDIPEIMG